MQQIHRLAPLAILLLLALPTLALAQKTKAGILNKKAPKLNVTQWHNVKTGKRVELSDYKGKVVYLYFFQSWCPGCHKSGFPTLQKLIQEFKASSDVQFVAIQTTFEGEHTNTFKRAKEVAAKYDLKIPIGHIGKSGARNPLMNKYRSGGTPWTVIVDRDGIVRFNEFHIQASTGKALIQNLINKKRSQPSGKAKPKKPASSPRSKPKS